MDSDDSDGDNNDESMCGCGSTSIVLVEPGMQMYYACILLYHHLGKV